MKRERLFIIYAKPLKLRYRKSESMVKEFIEGWDLIQVLGEGTFGEVKLLVNKANGEACAMKEIDLEQNPDAEDSVKKEICVHKLLKHKQIGA